MLTRRRLVRKVAAAIADGHELEWERIERLSRSPRERSLIDQFKGLTRLGRLRDGAAPTPWTPAVSRTHIWWMPVIALAFLQASLGITVTLQAIIETPQQQGLQVFQALILGSFTGVSAFLFIGSRADGRATRLAAAYVLGAAAFARPALDSARVPDLLSVFVSGLYPEAFLGFALWRFTREFPRSFRFSPFDRVSGGLTTAAMVTGGLLFLNDAAETWTHFWALGEFGGLMSALGRNDPSQLFWYVLAALILPALASFVVRSRSAYPDERRRVRLFLVGLAFGMAVIMEGTLEGLIPSFRSMMRAGGPFRQMVDIPVLLASVSVPFTTAYAVAVHQVLSFRLVIHRAVRHLLARSTLLVGAGLLAFSFALTLSRHQDVMLRDLLEGPQFVGARWLLVGLAVVLVSRRRLEALMDRWLVGQRVNHSQRLSSASEVIGKARDVPEIAQAVEDQIHQSFDVPRVGLLWREADGQLHPVSGSMPVLREDTALMALLKELPAVSVEPGGRLWGLLPLADQEWLARSGARALACMRGEIAEIRCVLAIAAQPSGADYSAGDLSFFAAVATMAGLAIGRQGGTRAPQALPREALECEACGRVSAEPCSCGGPSRRALLPVVLSEKFEVQQRLGRGGMGVVYLARDRRLDRPVALKTLPKVTGPAAEAMFAEARAMARVEHPHLALIYGIETWRSIPVLIVEYLPGGTLADRIAGGPLTCGGVLRMGAGLAQALAALHDEGLLHCDVKPSNIGFGRTGTEKLLDFGVARLVGHAEPTSVPNVVSFSDSAGWMTSHVAGTPLYMSPESLKGRAPDVRSDLWGLSVTLLEAMTGKHPFRDASLLNSIARLRHRTRLDGEELATLPDAIRSWFERALAQDIRDRPQRALDVADELTELGTRHG